MVRKLRFLGWAAVSSREQARQDKVSIPDQLESNQREIERRGGALVGQLVVPGQSRNIVLLDKAAEQVDGYLLTDGLETVCKPYAMLREMIEERSFDVLIYLDRSRLGRKASLSMSIVELCHEHGITTYELESPPESLTVNDRIDSQITGAVKSVMAQDEIRRIQERHRKGMALRVRRGEFPGNVPWPWVRKYRPDGSEYIEVDDTSLRTLHRLIDLYLNSGESQISIAKILNSEGRVSRSGRPWNHAAVSEVISLVWRYAGYVELNRQSKTGRQYVRVRSRWGAIIPEELALEIESERKRRLDTKQGWKRSKYRFTQVCYCIECGKLMTGDIYFWKNKDGTERSTRRYRCRGGHGGSIVERDVYAHIRAIAHHLNEYGIPDEIDEIDSNTEAERSRELADDLRQQESELQNRLEMADDMFFSGSLSRERYDRQVKRITAQLGEVQDKLSDLSSVATEKTASQRKAQLEMIRDNAEHYLTTDDVAAANAWFRKNFRISVYRGKIKRVNYI